MVAQRYESGMEASRRFWEIEVIGAEVQTRHGRVGTDGRLSEPKVFGTPGEARAEAERRIADRRKKGYEPVDDDVTGQACNPELVEAILRRPDDDAPYLVYGDWLQGQGDARGELVAVQHQLRQRPDDPLLQKREKALIRELMPARLGQVVKKKHGPGKAESGYCEVIWRLGFIVAARIGRNSDRPPYTVRELVAALLAHPAAQVLQSLTIGALGSVDDYDYRDVVRELCLARPRTLRELVLADFAPEHSELAASSLGDVSCLFRVLPRLERLHLRGGSMLLDDIDAPCLRELAITTCSFDARMVQAIGVASWPSLAVLGLRDGGAAFPASGLSSLLWPRHMPALRGLAILDTSDTVAIWQVLADSPLLPQLEVLDLSGGSLTDADIDVLLARREAFAHLRRLVLEANHLSDRGAAALISLCADVRVGGQRPVVPTGVSVTEQQLLDFAPDAKSMAAARKLVEPDRWPELGREDGVLWGRCQGSELYNVYVDTDAMESGCTCPSMKYPCKHALALLMMAQAHPVPDEPPPDGFIESCAVRHGGAGW